MGARDSRTAGGAQWGSGSLTRGTRRQVALADPRRRGSRAGEGARRARETRTLLGLLEVVLVMGPVVTRPGRLRRWIQHQPGFCDGVTFAVAPERARVRHRSGAPRTNHASSRA